MRARHKKWAAPYIAAHPQTIVTDPDQLQGEWEDRFPKKQPIYLEIGTGKGQFIDTIAKLHPEINFIGIELEESVVAMALKKVIAHHRSNVQLIEGNANQVVDFFKPHQIQCLFLNFSDPWPKKRHAKRRLTSSRFLPRYHEILAPNAPIKFKTDNRNFFEYSLKSMNNYGLKFDDITLDLHHSKENEHNIVTEYEEKTMSHGPIYRIVAHFPDKTDK
ncbi:tRNA (guanosine(46)-N7)-methyltransferase TrmB [Acetilactobacillus jinshanensis]|uniref:tRNA (guanine-N(7)-)-methyltransferase n=1 Tax=Acetilactobacillus jinshanensis TaxID=1720083 RepID=A0A4P6ZLP0_9LACO|nr:tRNA (guanosine(46)-N7)-methyltransferase TrmB [Acetilactobacillus jinshanensis]QBP18684.1 tRNA (guanosine(46)-N7)-methyltransferase TrmB [Acetilactobacillus jinshanensis]URL61560.1 tRNA (guanosine(46)-N7)-methyltransferase TrmB [uncultured bacterium]